MLCTEMQTAINQFVRVNHSILVNVNLYNVDCEFVFIISLDTLLPDNRNCDNDLRG